jgi:hypothetical protein
MRSALLAAVLSIAALSAQAAPLTAEDIQSRSNKEIEANLPDSHPAAYFAYAIKQFKARKQDPATLWYYIGQIRFRHYLLANPGLPADGDPAVYRDFTEGAFGKAIADWSGANTRIWARTIDDALAWDDKTPNNAVSKETFAAQWQQARAEVSKIRDYVKTSEAEIKAERAARGLTDDRR